MNSRTAALSASLLVIASCGEAPVSEAPPAPDVEAESEVPWIVVAANPMATDAGARVLQAGGSAADAAVAVQAVLGLVEPQSSGLGGGAFMLYYDASTEELIAYDGRERAPASAHPDIFIKEDGEPMGFFEAVTSGFSVGVPGAVSLLGYTHEKYGVLPWETLFEDAERLADEGFPMPGRLQGTLRRVSALREDPQASIFLDESGAPKELGTTVVNAPYAETVRLIAEGGANAFYEGPIAEAIIARVNERTGAETLTLDDFATYEPAVRKPVCAVVRTKTVCSMPPPSSGGITMLQIMQIFEAAADEGPNTDILEYIEANRLAFADRGRFLGDPSAMGTEAMSAAELIDALISPQYLAERAALIGDAPADNVEPGNPDGLNIREGFLQDTAYEVPSTTHFSIRDAAGNIISMTSTVEAPFGSQMMAGGMILNNQLTDFARIPRDGNRLAVNAPDAGKRPMSSMSPAVVFNEDGSPYAAIGSPGGPAIIGYVTRPLLDHLITGQPLSEAAQEPHIVVPRGSVIIEEGGDALTAEATALGYEVRNFPLASGLYGFTLSGDEVDLVVDPRREGSARTALD